MIEYLLTFLLVLGNYFDFSFFIFNIYTYYGMVGCMTCADAPLDLVVCVPFSDLYLFKIGIGMRSSLIIVCINSVFPFISFSIFSWPGANWFSSYVLLCYVSEIKSLRLFEPCPVPII